MTILPFGHTMLLTVRTDIFSTLLTKEFFFAASAKQWLAYFKQTLSEIFTTRPYWCHSVSIARICCCPFCGVFERKWPIQTGWVSTLVGTDICKNQAVWKYISTAYFLPTNTKECNFIKMGCYVGMIFFKLNQSPCCLPVTNIYWSLEVATPRCLILTCDGTV